jgi:ABC-type uncharacterized transport system substrate-binding protein
VRRREVFRLISGAAMAWPSAGRAQRPMPVIGYMYGGSPNDGHILVGFRDGLSETGFVDGQNVVIEFRWAEGHFERLPALVADLVSRNVAVIATPVHTPAALATKGATSAIPIVFSIGADPVQIGLVASFGVLEISAQLLASHAGTISILPLTRTAKIISRLRRRVRTVPNSRGAPLPVSRAVSAQPWTGAKPRHVQSRDWRRARRMPAS